MESIQNDLDLIRTALTGSLCHRSSGTFAAATSIDENEATHHEDNGEGGRVSRGWQQQHKGDVSLSIDDGGNNKRGNHCDAVAADRDTLELVKLREQVAALSTAVLDKAQLEVELSSREAALRQSIQEHHALSQRDGERQEQLQQAMCTLQQKTEELNMWRERHRRLQREADMLQQELDTLATQCERLETAVGELREVAQRACSENDKLREDLQKARVECTALRGMEVERDAATAREAALRDELHALLESTAESQEYFSAAKTEVEARRCYWTAVQEEHEVLQDALATAQETLRMWEARFLSERAAPPPSSLLLSEVQQQWQQEEEEEETLPIANVSSDRGRSSSSRRDADDDGETRLAMLEAKVVDLALHLREQRAAAESAGECYATLVAAVAQDGRELLDARRMLATRRPEWANLSEANEKLQAALLARESHVEALQELLVSLLDELTEQSLHCYELETQLAVKVVRSIAPNTTSRGPALRRSTALQLLQQQHGTWGGK